MDRVAAAYTIIALVIVAVAAALAYSWFTSHKRTNARRERRKRAAHDVTMAAKGAEREEAEP